MRDRDDNLFVGDEVLDRDLALGFDDFSAARVAITLADLVQLIDDDFIEELLARENGFELADEVGELSLFGGELFAL